MDIDKSVLLDEEDEDSSAGDVPADDDEKDDAGDDLGSGDLDDDL